MDDFLKQFTNPAYQMNLAYLVDIFTHLNKMNMQLQGSGYKYLVNLHASNLKDELF